MNAHTGQILCVTTVDCYHDYRKDDAQLFTAIDSNLIKKFSTVDPYFNNMNITELEIRPKSKIEAKTIVKNQISIRIKVQLLLKYLKQNRLILVLKMLMLK